jgi:hypothetical protein
VGQSACTEEAECPGDGHFAAADAGNGDVVDQSWPSAAGDGSVDRDDGRGKSIKINNQSKCSDKFLFF